MNKKIFILDTNILLHDPRAIYQFQDCILMIHIVTIDELESLKKETSERGYNARENIRILDSLRMQNPLTEGVMLENNVILKVYFDIHDQLKQYKQNDDAIIALAKKLVTEGKDVVLVSKDFAMRVKASLQGIAVDDYKNESISKDNFYQGWKEYIAPGGDIRHNVQPLLEEIKKKNNFIANEFLVLKSQHNDHYYRLFRYMNGGFSEINIHNNVWGIEAKNPHQQMIIDLLMDDNIKLITIFGPSGTGKTFLVLATMLYKVLCQKIYQKMIVSRPIVPLGNDLGYLPGDLYEKLQSWMQPIKDNLDFLLHKINTENEGILCPQNHESGYSKKKYYHPKGRRDRRDLSEPRKNKELRIEDLLGNNNKISLEAITYMRGRSIPFQVIFIDEVQNLTPHEVKTLISRAGEGSKVILVGDPYQIDSPYLDFVSNGLVVATEKFKGQPLFGSVYLHISERSELSALVNELM
jgi:PhoH-like ATPase